MLHYTYSEVQLGRPLSLNLGNVLLSIFKTQFSASIRLTRPTPPLYLNSEPSFQRTILFISIRRRGGTLTLGITPLLTGRNLQVVFMSVPTYNKLSASYLFIP